VQLIDLIVYRGCRGEAALTPGYFMSRRQRDEMKPDENRTNITPRA